VIALERIMVTGLFKELAHSLPASAWKTVTWRQGTKQSLRSRFAALRIRPAHRDYWRSEPRPEEWLLIEWPPGEAEPTKYWLSTLPADTKIGDLVRLAKQRWIIERDYQELKQELGLGHFEGRGWRGFHHHATLCVAAYGFLVAERSRFSPPHAPFFPDSCRMARDPEMAKLLQGRSLSRNTNSFGTAERLF
jgi:SRSO17 transposase